MRRLLLILFLLSACATPPPKEEPVEPVNQYPLAGWGATRTALMEEALSKYGIELISAHPIDAKEWCPGFDKVDKKVFWNHLFSALAKFESNHKSNTTYTEGFLDAKGKPVVSAGILQMSVESGRGYGCSATKTEDFFNDKVSMECAVKIAQRWVVKHERIQGGKAGAWLGLAKYWSPFRKAERIASMKEKLKEICK